MLAIPKLPSTPIIGKDTAHHPNDNNTPTLTPPVSRRPKLSLQTASLPTGYGGKSTTSMTKADANATITPTTRNTFANAFELSIRPSPTSATFKPITPVTQISAISSISSCSEYDNGCPYKVNLPFGIRSILKNGPLAHDLPNSITPSPRIPSRRVFFPPPKSVSFKNVLEEVVVTHIYVTRHSDLSSSEDEEDEIVRSDDGQHLSPSEDSDTVSLEDSESQRASKRRNRKASNDTIDEDQEIDQRGRADRSRSGSSRRSTRKRRRWEWTGPTNETTVLKVEDETSGVVDSKEHTPESDGTLPGETVAF